MTAAIPPFDRLYDRLIGRRSVHFLHVGKTGGTAVKDALQRSPITRRYRILLHEHATRLPDLPPGEPFFFLVRDPMARFVSGFLSRQRQGLPRYHYPWTEPEAIAFGRFETPNQLALSLEADDPTDRAAAVAAMGAIAHVRDSYWYWFVDEAALRARRDDLLFVGAQETLAEDFEQLKRLLHLPPELALPDDGVRSHRNPTGAARQLDERAEQILRSWYCRDYEFLTLCEELRPAHRAG